jgi:DNA-binding transcriptional ArsR family regulator
VQRLLADTGPVLDELVDQLAEYASRLIEPAWPRLLALCEADVLYRARRLALGGADALFEDLHPMLDWDGAVLTADKPHDVDLYPQIPGIVLIPAAFVNTLLLSTEDTEPTMIAYAARGRAALWCPERPAGGAALDSLLGPARASLLRLLGEPRSTGELAAALGLTPGTVSQQLGGLRRLGLAEPSRLGRRVYYRRTARGAGLLALFADEAPAMGEPVGLMASGAH